MSLDGFRFLGWLRFFGRKSGKAQGVKAKGRQARRSGLHAGHCRLVLEPLEDRTLLSIVNWVSASGGDWDTPGNWRDDQGVAQAARPRR